ncbi:unnamed protein product [Clavelina lepadiformis]|uniref:Large ribosomal subunit protein uL10m n=1 Tax=Clavelina lepadiformis TaxID=159417 RepID=A0ABP0FCU5_CLALP
MSLHIFKLGQLCNSCLRIFQAESATCTFLPKRFRYYWEARAENRQRKMLMMITVPKLRKNKDSAYIKRKQPDKLYGLDVLLHKEIQEIFNNNRMIAACLYADQPDDDYYRVRYELQQHEMSMEQYDQHVIDFTLKSTPYAQFLTLFDGPCTMIFGEPNVPQMISALKNNKQMLLIGGMVDGKYMSSKQLSDYANLKGLDHCRGELSGILSSAVSSTRDLLQQPAAALTVSLGEHTKYKTDDKMVAE